MAEYPKTNTRLRFGDFCFVPREDTRFAIFVYLQPVPKSRMAFYGAFAQCVLDSADISGLPTNVSLGTPAMNRVECYRENGLSLVGNIADRIAELDKAAAETVISSSGVGAVSIVWGYLTLPRHANEVLA